MKAGAGPPGRRGAALRIGWLVAVALLGLNPGLGAQLTSVDQADTLVKVLSFDDAVPASEASVVLVEGTSAPTGIAELQRALESRGMLVERTSESGLEAVVEDADVLLFDAGSITLPAQAAAEAFSLLTVSLGLPPAELGHVSVGLGEEGGKARIALNLSRLSKERHHLAQPLHSVAKVVWEDRSEEQPPGKGRSTPAELEAFRAPDYPERARRLGVEGTVVLRVRVDEGGGVTRVDVVEGVSKGAGLDGTAIRAAETARFRPATIDGVPIASWRLLRVPFKLVAG